MLHGADPLADIKIDPALEKFLCEQTLRNLRLRLVFSFVTLGRQKNYDQFVIGQVTALFVQLSEVLRLEGVTIPVDFAGRIPVFEREYKIDGGILLELLALKRAPHRLPDADAIRLHERLFPVVDAVLGWVEARWAV